MPLMTMRLFAEEKAQGTLEMLLALPVTDWEVVLGKFVGAMGIVATMLTLTLPYPVFLAAYGPLDWGPVIGGYIGLFLMASAYVSIGVMTSTWTREQLIAAIIAFLIGFALFLVGKLLAVMPLWLAPLLQALSFDHHFQSISRGVIDSRDLLFFASLTGVCLLVAQTSLESRRWR
jgi:ABC-2 type transport system permease protein